MHFVRRAALRASSSPSTSFLSKPRTIVSPFAIQAKQQPIIAQSIPKRFFSDQKPSGENSEGAVGEAIESAKEYASEAAESVKETYESAKAAAAEYAPRNVRGVVDRAPSGFLRDRKSPQVIKPTPTIYVGNLLFDVASADLEREFGQFGQIEKTVIATDDRGLSKGFGYVYFTTTEAASAAIEAKHQSVFEGRRIVVNYQIENSRHRASSPPTKTLFIGNIPFEMSDADLNKLFRDIKNVIDVRVAIDRRSGQPRGFAHADFLDVASATAGRENLAGKELYGRKLRVDFSASTRERRPESPPDATF